MASPLDTMQFYTKVLTGMVLLLNIGLLVSIRIALKHARLSSASERSEEGAKRWAAARRQIAFLILTVVAMNAGAVIANYNLVNATRVIAADLPQNTDAEHVLSMAE
jgi:cytochrome b561